MRRLDALFNEFLEVYKCLITDIDKTNSMPKQYGKHYKPRRISAELIEKRRE
ncbi:hypothetical protein GCWU000341_01649 [Oribacterium sp. oral taxon 078 str. F0262]|uniref:hypothetical protein n=1 Tax=Oribacterium sp. oral taxon 078 TaxID=652706 RepID=UPI0001CDEE31|nr:hypothetical protein [Oribacterium sp. oral taxon 078]EFE91482.1 hypothetical protein GCWU000341_01649 [Oribacterium sp. oral taxon 078 str. F0262]